MFLGACNDVCVDADTCTYMHTCMHVHVYVCAVCTVQCDVCTRACLLWSTRLFVSYEHVYMCVQNNTTSGLCDSEGL